MKTLENHTLLYDNDCPLCKAYTNGFIKTDMLDNNGRKPFNKLSQNEQSFVDAKRARNEIALIDTKNNTVIYGIDSLLKVIGNSFPTVERIGHLKPIKFLLKRLYSFISYNRKVIVPGKTNDATELECVPDFNYTYRVGYIIFAIITTTLVLFKFSNTIVALPQSTIQIEFILASGQIVLQCLFLLNIDTKTIINYIGNLMTVSLVGSIILTPLLILNSFIHMSESTIVIVFGLIVLFMFFEHFRRVKILELPSYLSYTWALYRIIALLIIILNI